VTCRIDDAYAGETFLIQVEEVRQIIRNRASFFLPAGFVAVMPKRSVGLGNELGADGLSRKISDAIIEKLKEGHP
jgi:hypothetical protein